MSDNRGHRISNAIDSLITHLVPKNPHDDEQAAQDRYDACFELVKSHVDISPSTPALSSDVNHASDLIKRKLIQSNPSQALRFSNLYTRLLSLPVLGQKWGILYLLYQLSDSPDPNEPLPLTPLRQPFLRGPSRLAAKEKQAQAQALAQTQTQTQTHAQAQDQDQAQAQGAAPPTKFEDSSKAFDEAFAPGGLKQFPPEKARRGPDDQPAPAQASSGPSAEPVSKKDARDVSLKSVLLADNSVEIDPSETIILRDLPFTLQGLSSTTFPFARETALKLPATLPSPIISLLHTLAEPSLLYRGLANFVQTQTKSLLGQSLRAAIGHELRSYLGLVATLEGQIRRALSTLDDSAPRHGIGNAGVTLKRCVVWTREATMGLRLLSLIAEESSSRRGGQLISLIHGFSSTNGDPIVAAFAERLLAHVTRPFYDMLRRWIYDGELSDPHREFFVREQGGLDDEERRERKAKGLASAWNSRYQVDDAMVPSITTADFAQKVFLIGKSLNFIRHGCGDSPWVEAYSKTSSKELCYGDTATLEAWIDEAYKTTMRRLMQLMTSKFHLLDHLQALKNYILLGQGDFIALLMESLAGNLDRPAGAQYRHTLTAQLEHAIRGSNAQYDSPEVLRRLDARMLRLSHGDIGWDCFTLEYKIDAPVDVVVTEWGNRQYLKVFNFLWRIKRVEFALASTWRKCMTGSRGVLQTTDEVVLHTWKGTRGTLAEMIHFVGQLQYYILFEVIESSWAELQRDMARENCTLDDVITAHTRYLTAITHKGLLGARRRRVVDVSGGSSGDASNDPGEDRNSYMVQLGELLRTMLAYRDTVDGLYSWSVSDFTRRQEADAAGMMARNVASSADISTQQRKGGRGAGTGAGSKQIRSQHQPSASTVSLVEQQQQGNLDDEDGGSSNNDSNSSAVRSEFPALQERLRQLGGGFRTRLQVLLGDLAYQPDVDMRFLGVAMNFNDVYQPVRRKTSKTSASAAQAAVAAVAEKRLGQQQQQQQQPDDGGNVGNTSKA